MAGVLGGWLGCGWGARLGCEMGGWGARCVRQVTVARVGGWLGCEAGYRCIAWVRLYIRL